jgi:aspartate kinase
MGIKVAKFGGSSLADAQAFRKVKDIVAADPERRYVVASAPGKRFAEDEKVTDMLYQCYELAAAGKDPIPVFTAVENRYRQILTDLALPCSLEEEFQTIRTAMAQAPCRDYLASRGEYLNGKVLAACLGYGFVDPAEGIFFREDGSLDEKKTYKTLSRLVKEQERAVIPGFYGTGADGRIKTFTRGGSDVTGAVVARAIGAQLYENWTDVSGMLMADPRYVENPETIGMITYPELRELTYMGATVLHEDAVFPARSANIPINIRNTNRPQDPGTRIVPQGAEQPPVHVITGVAGRKGFASLTVEKDRMNAELGFGRRVLSALEERKISFEHLPTGIDTLSVFVLQADIAPWKPELISEIMHATQADSITIEEGIALIAVVGRGMVGTVGVASRLLTAVESKGIHVKMIDQGSSGLNIIIGVCEKDYEKAIHAIYQEFVK